MKTEEFLLAAACLPKVYLCLSLLMCLKLVGCQAELRGSSKNMKMTIYLVVGKEMRAKESSVRERFSGLTKEM